MAKKTKTRVPSAIESIKRRLRELRQMIRNIEFALDGHLKRHHGGR